VLSREEIVEAVLSLADRRGVEGLTMRAVARELGVGTMTLYGYFASKDELMDATVERAAEGVRIPADDGPWRPRLRALFEEIHRSLLEHPSGVRLRLERPMLTPAALRTTEAGLSILEAAGFSRREATRAWRALFVYTFGHAAFTPARVPGSAEREWLALLSGLPGDEFPALTAAAGEAVETMSGEASYGPGLDWLLDGLEALLARRTAAAEGPLEAG
jgi:AcrR family transcriptional regulator